MAKSKLLLLILTRVLYLKKRLKKTEEDVLQEIIILNFNNTKNILFKIWPKILVFLQLNSNKKRQNNNMLCVLFAFKSGCCAVMKKERRKESELN